MLIMKHMTVYGNWGVTALLFKEVLSLTFLSDTIMEQVGVGNFLVRLPSFIPKMHMKIKV